MSIDKKTVAYFNHMHQALKTIGKYQTPEKLRRSCGKGYGTGDYQETLEMAYENIQSTAKGAIQGIKPIAEQRAESKWLAFIKQPAISPKQKTDRYRVYNKDTQYCIGEIKWYGAFRQYSFFPADNCVFEKTCLQDITDFLNQLMDERKKAKANE